MNARPGVHLGERMLAIGSKPKGGEGVDSDRELMLEDARSIREGLWRIARPAQDAAESLDGRIEDEDLDGMAEAVEVREVLEKVQDVILEVSEELDAYQNRHGG
jgi:hypothetical protein